MNYCKFFICDTQASLNAKIESGVVTDTDIVFVKSSKQLWTHGITYNCPYSAEQIQNLISASETNVTGLINQLKAVATTENDGLMSKEDKIKLNELVSSAGEPNQFAFSYVKVGNTTLAADNATDTLNLTAGSNITLTPDVDSDSITITATDTTYNPASSSEFGVVKIGTATGKANGTASAGTTTGGVVAAIDHVHPLQTTVSGNAGTASKLKTAQNIALSGAVSGSASFDGSAGITIATTLANIDASKITSGTISIDRLPKGALERLVTVADDTARFKLTSDDVQLGDTVKVTSSGKMYYVVDTANLDEEAGYEVYVAGAAASVPWSGVTGKPTTFAPSTHSHTKSEITDFPTSLKNPNSLTISLNGTSQGAYDGSSAKTIDITPASIGASAEGHDHLYAGSATAGGSATSAVKLDSSAGSSTRPIYFSGGKPAQCGDSLAVSITGKAATAGTADQVANSSILTINGGTTEGTNKYTFNGSASKSVNVAAGDNVTLTAEAGSLTIAAKDTTYGAGTGISLSSGKFGLATVSGLTAGTVGPTANVTGTEGATISVPQITVDSYGRVTGITSFTYTSKDSNNQYTAGTGLSLNSGAFSLAASGATAGNYGMSTATTGNEGTKINIPYITVDTYGRVTSISNKEYTSKNTTYSDASTSESGLMSKDDKAKLDALGSIKSISKTLTVSTSWIDTGILLSGLNGSGTYVVQVYLNNSATNGAYQGYWSGIMSVYDGNTNATTSDEIVLHCSSQSNGADIFLRTVRQSGSSTASKLQISSSVSIASTTYSFKFRKLI